MTEPALVPTPLSEAQTTWIEKTLGDLSLRERIGQMFMPFLPASTSLDEIERVVAEAHPGGLRLSGVGLDDQRPKIKRGQATAKVPLFVPGNLESGAGQVVEQCTSFTSQMGLGATGDERLAERMGEAIAIEGKAVGYNMYLGPVVDICATPHCPKNIRSLGRDPGKVARLAASIVGAVQSRGMACSPKHFPGNGFAANDTHLTTHVNPLDRDGWLRESGMPFKACIDAGAYTIMGSHIALPSWDAECGDPHFPRPASLSRPLLQGLLRDELGFDGVIVTDAINMGGMSMHLPYFEMVLEAVKAGNDIMLFLRRPVEVADYLEKAVVEKRLDEERITDAARRVLTVKARIGLHDGERVSSDEQCAGVLDRTPYGKDAAEMAERSLTLLRDRRNAVPLSLEPGASILSVVVTNKEDFQLDVFDGVLSARGFGVTSMRAPMDVTELYDRVEAGEFDALIVSLHYPPSFGWNSERCHGPESRGLMNGWMIANPDVPCVYISFANPHHLHEFPYMDPYLCTWGGARFMQEAAARALLGEIPIAGKAPIRLDGFWEIGDGIERGAGRQ